MTVVPPITDLLFLERPPSDQDAAWIRSLSPAPMLWLGGRHVSDWVGTHPVCGWLDAPYGQSSPIARQINATVMAKAGATAIAPTLPVEFIERQAWDELSADLRATVIATREVRPEVAILPCLPASRRDAHPIDGAALIACLRANGADALVDPWPRAVDVSETEDGRGSDASSSATLAFEASRLGFAFWSTAGPDHADGISLERSTAH